MGSQEVYDMGYAIGSYNLESGKWSFRFKDERFDDAELSLGGKPSKYVDVHPLKGLKYGWVAKVDELRKANANAHSD